MAAARPSCLLEEAASALFPGHVPLVLPGRREEETALEEFVRACLTAGQGGTLALCGAPGVGKSATLAHLLSKLSDIATSCGCASPTMHVSNALSGAEANGLPTTSAYLQPSVGTSTLAATAAELWQRRRGFPSAARCAAPAAVRGLSGGDGEGGSDSESESDGGDSSNESDSSEPPSHAAPATAAPSAPSPNTTAATRAPASQAAPAAAVRSAAPAAEAAAAAAAAGSKRKRIDPALAERPWSELKAPPPAPAAATEVPEAASAQRRRGSSSGGASCATLAAAVALPAAAAKPRRPLLPARPAAAAPATLELSNAAAARRKLGSRAGAARPSADHPSTGAAREAACVELALSRTAQSFRRAEAGQGAAAEAKLRPRSRRAMHLIVIDEMDGLLSGAGGRKGVELLRQLLWLPAQPATRHVIVVGVSNFVDLPARLAPAIGPSAASEGSGSVPPPPPQIVVFTTYGVPEITSVVAARLAEATAQCGLPVAQKQSIIEPLAIELLAKRVNKASGDVRLALGLARRAVLAASAVWCSSGGGGDDDTSPHTDRGPLLAPSPVQTPPRPVDPALAAAEADLRDLFAACMPEAASAAAAAAGRGGAGAARAGSSPSGAVGGRPRGGAAATGAALAPRASSAAAAATAASTPGVNAAACECLRGGGRWLSEAAPSAAADTGTSAAAPAPPPRFAVTFGRMRSLLAAAFDSPYVELLRTLPLHGQVIMCAARALAERAALKLAAAEAAEAEAANPTYFPSHEGATAVRLSDAAHAAPGRWGGGRGGKQQPSAAAIAKRSAAAALVPIAALSAAHAAICRKKLMAGLAASEFSDILDRLVADGLLSIATGAGGGSGARGSAALAARAADARLSRGSVLVNVSTHDLDAALGEVPLYRALAADVKAGRV